MKPTTEPAAPNADEGNVSAPEQFVRQRPDDSLPAEKVLTEQQHGHEAQVPPPLFVP